MRLLTLLLLMYASAEATANELYVSPGGDDAVPYTANSPARPWATIRRAARGTSDGPPNAVEAARPGDVVHVAAGTYATAGGTRGGGGARWDVAYNPINEGTSTAPIRFQCDEQPCQLTFSSGAGPMIGSNSRDYIEWSGFTISEATAPTRPDTGPVTFFDVIGGVIEHSILTGDPNGTKRGGDNYNGIRLEDARGVTVRHNVIRDYGGQTTDRNHSGLTTYRSFPVTIEHNRFENCSAGIYMKAVEPSSRAVDTVVIRFNRFVNNRWGINAHRMPMSESQPMLIYQNIFERNRGSGTWLTVFDNGTTDPAWIRVFNNTFVDNGAGFFSFNFAVWKPESHHLYQNNIVAGSGLRIRMDTRDVKSNSTPDKQLYDRNLYGTGPFAEIGGAETSFSSWQRLGQDRQSVEANPQFADADYRLLPKSPARDLGRAVHGIGGADGTVIPAGAYITGKELIGPGRP